MVVRGLSAMAIIVLVALSPGRAAALSCLSPEATIERSEVVFAGTIVERVDDAAGGPPDEPSSFAVVEVSQIWKGEIPATVVLTMDPVGTEWRPELRVGQSLAFMVAEDRHISTDCDAWSIEWIGEILGSGTVPDQTLAPESLPEFALSGAAGSASRIGPPLVVSALVVATLGVFGVKRYVSRSGVQSDTASR